MDAATTTGQITIGQSGIVTAPLGVGTWAWGERRFWGYGKGYGREDVAAAFRASVAAGLTLFDTAEIYGFGRSERILGEALGDDRDRVVLASKIFPIAPFPAMIRSGWPAPRGGCGCSGCRSTRCTSRIRSSPTR